MYSMFNKKPTPAQVKRLIKKAITRKQDMLAGMESSTNPLTVKLCVELRAEIDALDSTLQALNGDTVLLRIHAGE